jgi:hypothetical protein
MSEVARSTAAVDIRQGNQRYAVPATDTCAAVRITTAPTRLNEHRAIVNGTAIGRYPACLAASNGRVFFALHSLGDERRVSQQSQRDVQAPALPPVRLTPIETAFTFRHIKSHLDFPAPVSDSDQSQPHGRAARCIYDAYARSRFSSRQRAALHAVGLASSIHSESCGRSCAQLCPAGFR